MMPAITVHILQISKMNNKIYCVFKVTLITSSGIGTWACAFHFQSSFNHYDSGQRHITKEPQNKPNWRKTSAQMQKTE